MEGAIDLTMRSPAVQGHAEMAGEWGFPCRWRRAERSQTLVRLQNRHTTTQATCCTHQCGGCVPEPGFPPCRHPSGVPRCIGLPSSAAGQGFGGRAAREVMRVVPRVVPRHGAVCCNHHCTPKQNRCDLSPTRGPPCRWHNDMAKPQQTPPTWMWLASMFTEYTGKPCRAFWAASKLCW